MHPYRGSHRILVRHYAAITSSSSAPPPAYAVFDRSAKRKQKNRAVLTDKKLSKLADYVKDDVAGNLVDRLLDIKRRFPAVLDLGSGAGHLIKHLDPEITQKITMTDSAVQLLHRDQDEEYEVSAERIQMDEEHLQLAPESQDAILSCCSLHWVNDLPGTFIQIQRALREDGVFIAAILGGDSLFELRTSIQLAQLERHGGLSPHVSPMTDSQSMSNLLSRAGFALPAIDVDEIRISYPSIFELVEDLRAMGESNAVMGRKAVLSRDTLIAAASIYKELHGNEDGTIPATFQVIYAIGWKPSPTQPKPLARGSAKVSLKDALGSGGNQDPSSDK